MSVDTRTRLDSEQAPVDPQFFFGETLPGLLDAHQSLMESGARSLDLGTFALEIEDEAWTLAWRDDRVEVSRGITEGPRARVSPQQFTDLVNDQSTPIALMSNNLLDMPEGGLPDFLNWWLVLRSALDAQRVHARGDLEIDKSLLRSFSPEDSDELMREYLEQFGYLHIKGLFSAEEMAAVEADFPVAAPHFEKGDPRAWFAQTQDGVEHLVRI